jgi:hypothetical protein
MKKQHTAPSETITVNQLGNLANLTPRRIRQMGEEGALPKAENARLPMVEAIRMLFAFYQKDSVTLERERTLKVGAERKLREIELARVEGEFLKKDEVGRACQAIGTVINSIINNRLELRLRVTAMERFNLKAATPPLTPEQIAFVADVFCELGRETSATLKSELKSGLSQFE